jgi:N-acetylglucosaminyldiphosphoundecaprenol N-acetyl-beta-D-mannosaminyltransferase
MNDAPNSKVDFVNVRINVFSRTSFFDALKRRLSSGQQVTINFLNAHCFNVAQENSEYRNALNNCTFLLNDGVGVDMAGKLIGVRFHENLNGTDLIPEMLELFSDKDMTVFFFGAKKNVIEAAVRKMEARFPRLSVAGYCDGYVNDPNIVIDQVNNAKADVLILGLGVPLQELWVANHGNRLESTKVLVSGGAIFDFISGSVKRAPTFVRAMKLEWLFRLSQEPRRLFSRYIIGNFLFFYNVLSQRN